MNTLRIALTSGEPAGIGPELVVQLAQHSRSSELVVLADPDLLQDRAALLGLPLQLYTFDPTAAPRINGPGELCVLPVSLASPSKPGQLNPSNASYVLETLSLATDGCKSGQFAAMVTAPVQKSVINDAGIAFSGHTEFLAQRTGAKEVVMMLACEGMRVALVTTHLPLSAVPGAVTHQLLESVVEILDHSLQQHFGVSRPEITVLGLNPHAGEGGHMGREELDVIIPTLDKLRQQGLQLVGPLPADTAFSPHTLANSDAILAMYHDQGLPVLKYAGFGAAVNITLGLPIIRTSVDHGTALDLAGTGKASLGSLQYAVHCAQSLAQGEAP